MYRIEHLKADIHYEGVRGGLLALLGSFVKKLCAPVERAATMAVVLLVAALVISVFMRLGEAGALSAYYGNACDVAPTMIVAPQ
jgi:hypothetical protein